MSDDEKKLVERVSLLREFELWDKLKGKRVPYSFDLEITARCNNNCRHCYINKPADDQAAKAAEITIEEIDRWSDEAVALGSLWCLITGGEPLLRRDFADIYMMLKRKGLLISVFTNATLVKEEHIRLWKSYPPRDLEVTIYGASPETYDRVTGVAGAHRKFQQGVNRLLEAGLNIRFKAMALKSNFHEVEEIGRFARANSREWFRFDPQLHLRLDGDQRRNDDIRSERLLPEEIRQLEARDEQRQQSLQDACKKYYLPNSSYAGHDQLFYCNAGMDNFYIGADGRYQLCSSLSHPDCVYDLRQGSVTDAWENFTPKVRALTSSSPELENSCRKCPLLNLCMWCPAHAYLETGHLDRPVNFFCQVTRARVSEFI